MVYLDNHGSRDGPPDSDEGRYCIDCHYALTGLDSPGKCPECGRFFNFADYNSFTYDAHPPTIAQRAFSYRSVALLAFCVLEGLAIWPYLEGWVCVMVPFFPFWMFTQVWLACVVTGMDRSVDRLGTFMLASAVIGGLLLLPMGFGAMCVGILGGAVSGLYMKYLQDAGWFD